MPRIIPLLVTLSAAFAIGIWLWHWHWHWLDKNQASKEPGEISPLIFEEHTPEHDSLPKSSEENQERTEKLAADSIPEAIIDGTEEVVALSTSFMNAASAVDAEDAIVEAKSYDLPVANDWRMRLDVACHSEELKYILDQTNESRQYFAQKLSSFCEGYLPETDFARPMDLEELDQSFLDLARTQFRDDIARSLSELGSSETDDFLVRQLKAANTPEKIDAVGEYLSEYYRTTGQVLWRPQVGNVGVPDAAITSLQQVALELYSCQKFGGCGPNSLKVLRLCAFVVGCQPGWSYEQYVFANHSPMEMEYIQAVLRHIYSG